MSRIARALAILLLLPGLAAAQLKPARMSNATTENLTLIPGSITTNNITAVALATPGSITVTPVLTQTATITTVAAGWRASGLLTVIAGAGLVDGETFVLSDGTHVPQSFEFDVAADGVVGGHVDIDITGTETAEEVGALCDAAINNTTSGTFTYESIDNLDGTVTLRNTDWAAAGNTAQSETVTDGTFTVTNMTGGADAGIVDGDYLTVKYSLAGTIPIEFDTGDGTTGGRIPLVFDGTESADDIRDALIALINTAAPAALTASSGGAATVNITLDVPGAVGDTNTENVSDGTFAVTGFTSPAATTWTYKLVARLVDGTTTEAGAASSTAAGGPTLSAANKNVLTWSKVTNAASYDVYRTVAGTSPATLGKINTGPIVGVTLTDSGLAGDASTAPTVNGTGVITAARFVGAGGGVPVSCTTAGMVPIFLGSPVALGCDAGLTYDAATDTLTVVNTRAAGTYLQDGYQSWFDTTAHNGTTAYRTILLTHNGGVGGGFLQSKNHRYGFSSNAGNGDGDIAGTEDTYMSRAAAATMGFNGGIRLTTGARPTCDATTRGTFWYVAGGAGVADTCEICRKDGADAYAWVTLF